MIMPVVIGVLMAVIVPVLRGCIFDESAGARLCIHFFFLCTAYLLAPGIVLMFVFHVTGFKDFVKNGYMSK
jgi:hypothetical protein